MGIAGRGVLWIGVYVAAALTPLIVARLATPTNGSGFWIDLSVGLGFSGLAILVMQFALVARFQRVSAPFGMDALHQFHRQIALVAFVLILAHPTVVFVTSPGWLAVINPANAPRQVWFGFFAVGGLLIIAITSFGRKRLRLNYEWWQAIHALLAAAVVALALVHANAWNRYMANPWQRGFWLLMAGGVLAVIVWTRLIKPLRLRSRPWKVVSVHEERGDAWTIELEPDGHEGITFSPGQFAWVLIGRSPFRVTQHPFSLSSSAEAGRVTMTIKSRGDFTKTIRDVQPGTRAYLDGPHGMFTPDRFEGPGFVFVAGGVGITPLISMIRTMHDRQDVRPAWLFYGSKEWDSVTFREELDDLSAATNLNVIHAIEDPSDGYVGETGFINAAMLQRHLNAQFKRMQYFVCGPTPMMDAMENVLAELGVPDEHVHTERFDVV